MPTRIRCSLLCEDVEQENFFRPILEHELGRVRVEARKPVAGASFVLKQVARLVRFVRQRASERVALVIVIDGDTFGRDHRLQEVNRKLQSEGLAGLDEGERIALCVPCRNIETWEVWLCLGGDLNETDDFKKRWSVVDKKAKDAAKAWRASSPATITEESSRLPALAAARRRIRFLASS